MKRYTKRILCISLSLLILLAAVFALEYFVLQVPMFDRSGWEQTDTGAVCYLDYYGRPLKKWQSIDGIRRYFDPKTGQMHTGWLQIQQDRFYLADDGTVQTGWQEIAGERYYFAETGIMQTGWLSLPEGKYYLGQTGIMQTGWADTEDGRRYFDAQGLLQDHWRETEAGRHYVKEDGTYLTGWLVSGEYRYYFNAEGVMQTGWVADTGGRFYLYEDGTFAKGFVEIDGIKRYFMPTGEYIILTNRWNSVPKDYQLNLVKLEGYQVDAACMASLKQMLKDCRAAGYACTINSAYRSVATQQSLWDTRYKKYTAQGYSGEEANEIIGRSVAIPGTSEHHLGLAVDIKGSNAMYNWLAKNSWKYGFILRYPDNKIDITGILYEPWHFRYVGKDFAKGLYNSGLCMEEYLKELETNAI